MIKSRLTRALNRFGMNFEIIRESENIDLKGKLGKVKRTTIPWATEHLKDIIFGSNVVVNPDDLIHDKTQNIYYIVYTLHRQYKAAILIAQELSLLSADKLSNIQRLQGETGSFGGTKQSFQNQSTDIRCHIREIDKDLRAERPGLLESAVGLLYMQNTKDLKVLDRVVIDGINYQVEHIDKTTFKGIFEAQVSLDTR